MSHPVSVGYQQFDFWNYCVPRLKVASVCGL